MNTETPDLPLPPRRWPRAVHSNILCLVVVACCLLLSNRVFGQGADFPPGFPFPPADSPLGWEGGLLGNSLLRQDLAERGVTVLGINQT